MSGPRRPVTGIAVFRLLVWSGHLRVPSSRPSNGNVFPLSTSSRQVLGLTHFPTHWVRWGFFQGLKRPGREADLDLYIHFPIRFNGLLNYFSTSIALRYFPRVSPVVISNGAPRVWIKFILQSRNMFL
jgi:hypothetical protein